jgi:hypothetical protein
MIGPLKSLTKFTNEPFWELARKAKSETDTNLDGLSAELSVRFCHDCLNATSKFELSGKKAQFSDLNLSNIGRYPFSQKLKLKEGDLEIKSVHLYNNTPTLAPSIVLFISNTGDHLHYSMAHRLDDENGKMVFQYFVNIIEHVASIQKDEKLDSVAARLKNYSQ